jgi:hypothetical protein
MYKYYRCLVGAIKLMNRCLWLVYYTNKLVVIIEVEII